MFEEKKIIKMEPLKEELVNQVIDHMTYLIDSFRDRIVDNNASYFSAPITIEYLQEMREKDYQAWLRTMKSYFMRIQEYFLYHKYFRTNDRVNHLAEHFMKTIGPQTSPTIESFERELCYQIENWQ